MKLVELEKKLIAAARRHAPSDQVPYAFEKRVIAHLKSMPIVDHWALWAGALWRGAVACIAVVVLVGAVAFHHSNSSSSNSAHDLSLDFEKTLLASVDQDIDYSR